jgi:hypothetical protein
MNLHEFLRLPRGWAWGGVVGDDCTTFCASWVFEATGKDVSAGLRGTYDTAEAANAIVEDAGGIEAFVAARLAPMGFKRVQQPQEGDIGIVEGVTGFDLDGATIKSIPAICFGPCHGGHLWAVMSARGPQVKKLNHSMAWRIA